MFTDYFFGFIAVQGNTVNNCEMAVKIPVPVHLPCRKLSRFIKSVSVSVRQRQKNNPRQSHQIRETRVHRTPSASVSVKKTRIYRTPLQVLVGISRPSLPTHDHCFIFHFSLLSGYLGKTAIYQYLYRILPSPVGLKR